MRCLIWIIDNANPRRRVFADAIRQLPHPIRHTLLSRMVATEINRAVTHFGSLRNRLQVLRRSFAPQLQRFGSDDALFAEHSILNLAPPIAPCEWPWPTAPNARELRCSTEDQKVAPTPRKENLWGLHSSSRHGLRNPRAMSAVRLQPCPNARARLVGKDPESRCR